MILRLKNDQYQCLWWQLAAYFAKNSAKNEWFFWLCSNVQIVPSETLNRLSEKFLSLWAFIRTIGTVSGIKNRGSWWGKMDRPPNETIKVNMVKA